MHLKHLIATIDIKKDDKGRHGQMISVCDEITQK
jgi:hypothetical protein